MKYFCTLVFLLAMGAPTAHAQSRSDLDAQIVRQSGGGLETPTDKPFYRLHSRFQAVKLPALGANVLYLEEYRDNDPAKIARIRLYSLTVDEAARGASRHASRSWLRRTCAVSALNATC